MRMSASLTVVSVLSIILCGAAVAEGPGGAGGAGLSIHYFKEARPMRLDASRIAILVVDGAGRSIASVPGELVEALGSVGVDGARAERWPIHGWWMVPIGADARAGRSAVDIARDAVGATELVATVTGARVAFVSPVFIDDLGGPMYVTPQILAQFAPGVDRAAVEIALAETGAGAVIEADWCGVAGSYRIEGVSRNGMDVLAAANALAIRGDVVYAEPDMAFTGRSDLIPNEPSFSNCWGLHNTGQFGGSVVDMDMNGPQAWDTTLGSASIFTVILDTGVQQDHPDINQIPGFDTTTDGGDGGPMNSFDSHGTAVGGCVSAIANNALGTVGIAPGTRIVSARTFISINASGNWTSNASWTASSLSIAESLGARVSNNSNYYGFTSGAIASMYALTRSNGMVHFASAGNDASSTVSYPSSLPTVMAIGALNPNGTKASFSNFGPDMDFMAPGSSVYSTDRTGSPGYFSGDYGYVQGTSFASPYAAGVAALLLSRCDSMTAEEVEAKLFASCTDLGAPGRDDTFGLGLIRADQAISGVGVAPCDFVLLAPGDGATDVSPGAPLDWADAPWADSYRIEVFNDLGSPVIDEVVTGGSTYVPSGGELLYDRAYTWSVAAVNGEGETPSAPTLSAFTTAPSPCVGDVNDDGSTNIADFNILALTFGLAVPTGSGPDLAEDGVVNIGDFNVLAFDFGCGS